MFRVQKVKEHKYVKYTCSMESVQQNGRFTLFSSKFHSNIYSILYGFSLYFTTQRPQNSIEPALTRTGV